MATDYSFILFYFAWLVYRTCNAKNGYNYFNHFDFSLQFLIWVCFFIFDINHSFISPSVKLTSIVLAPVSNFLQEAHWTETLLIFYGPDQNGWAFVNFVPQLNDNLERQFFYWFASGHSGLIETIDECYTVQIVSKEKNVLTFF